MGHGLQDRNGLGRPSLGWARDRRGGGWEQYQMVDLLAKLDWIDRVHGYLAPFWLADWGEAWEQGGVVGVLREFWACVTRRNTWQFAFRRDGDWRGIDVERLLVKGYHVTIFDRWFTKAELLFRVMLRQADWAEYLMCRAGVPLVGEVVNPGNLGAWERYGGRMPPRWDERGGRRKGRSLWEDWGSMVGSVVKGTGR